MRAGIFNLLRAFEVDLSKEMPYHETLTMFWMRTVDDFRKTKNDCSLVEICNELDRKIRQRLSAEILQPRTSVFRRGESKIYCGRFMKLIKVVL